MGQTFRKNRFKRSLALLAELSMLRLHMVLILTHSSKHWEDYLLEEELWDKSTQNGSNFVGAEQKSLKAFSEMDHNKIENSLQDHGGDWITWKRNSPAASHMGGIWEKQTRSARAILNSLLQTHGHSLGEESLKTLMTETQAIINSWPLTVETINDGQSPMSIPPNNILTMKAKVVMSPPGVF